MSKDNVFVPGIDEWHRIVQFDSNAEKASGVKKLQAIRSTVEALEVVRRSIRIYVTTLLWFLVINMVVAIAVISVSMFPIYSWGSAATGALSGPAFFLGATTGLVLLGFNDYTFFVRPRYRYLRLGVYIVTILFALLYAVLQLVWGVSFCNNDSLKTANPGISLVCQLDLAYLYFFMSYGFLVAVVAIITAALDGVVQSKVKDYTALCQSFVLYNITPSSTEIDKLSTKDTSSVLAEMTPSTQMAVGQRYLTLVNGLAGLNDTMVKQQPYDRMYFWIQDITSIVKHGKSE